MPIEKFAYIVPMPGQGKRVMKSKLLTALGATGPNRPYTANPEHILERKILLQTPFNYNPSTPVVPVVPANGLLNSLVHYYQFQEAAGPFADSGSSPLAVNCTNAGADFTRVAGHVQPFAAHYAGTNSIESINTIVNAFFDFTGDNTGNLSMSYCCWFNWSSSQVWGFPDPIIGIVGPVGASQAFILRRTAAHTIQWTVVPFGGGASASVTNVSVADDAWHLFVGGFDFANGRIFMSIDNGAVQTAALATMNSIGTQPFMCFNWNAGTNVESVGSLSDVGIWKGRVLSATDITNLWNGGAGLPFSQFTT